MLLFYYSSSDPTLLTSPVRFYFLPSPQVVDKYSPSKRWQIDTLITTLSIAGNSIENDAITHSLILLITQVPTL